jgi:hypothetical protein
MPIVEATDNHQVGHSAPAQGSTLAEAARVEER